MDGARMADVLAVAVASEQAVVADSSPPLLCPAACVRRALL